MKADELRARAVARAADAAVQQWYDEHANDTHPPCDRCGRTTALVLTTCSLCTFALCPRCTLMHRLMRLASRQSLCAAVIEWATFHAAFRQDDSDAIPTAEDFAAAREAMKGYLR